MLDKILFTSIVSLFIVSNCLAQNKADVAQNKVDLELTVQSAAKSVRGGEKFAYSITVRNIGSAKATDVILIQDEPKSAVFVSFAPSKGICKFEKYESVIDRQLNCRLSDLEIGETVVVSVETNIRDFGDVSITEESVVKDSSSALLANLMKATAAAKGKISQIIGNADVAAEEREENDENNHAPILVELLPSKNIPPRVKITSPKNDSVVVRSSKKPVAVTFTIEAFDPDGTIERVEVNTQQLNGVGFSQGNYIIGGVKYSEEELVADKTLSQKLFGGDAVKIGKNIYTYTLENPQYSFNNVSVTAYDDGGRSSESSSVRFMVKDDSSIEFVNPLKDAIIKPQTDVIIETETKTNDGKPPKIRLIGNTEISAGGLMRLISQKGNVYRHQYVLKNVVRGYYNLQVLLLNDSGTFTNSADLAFKVAKKLTVKISCPKKPAVFIEGEDIPLDVEAADADGQIGDIAVSANGEYGKFSWRTNGYLKNGYFFGLPKGTYTIIAKVENDLNIETESAPLTIVVK